LPNISSYDDSADVPKNRENVPLQLPSVSRFIFRQLVIVVYTFLLNAALAALCWTFVQYDWARPSQLLQLFPGTHVGGSNIILFGTIAAIAALSNSVGPIHVAHDSAIRFLHNIELCKQLSREIALANYASDRTKRKQWADDIRKSYRPKRRAGKTALIFLFFVTATVVIVPWAVALQATHGLAATLVVVALLTPVIVGDAIETIAMVWPGKRGFLLGGFYRS